MLFVKPGRNEGVSAGGFIWVHPGNVLAPYLQLHLGLFSPHLPPVSKDPVPLLTSGPRDKMGQLGIVFLTSSQGGLPGFLNG